MNQKNHYRLIPEDDYTLTENKDEAIRVFEKFHKRKINRWEVEYFEMRGCVEREKIKKGY